MLKTVMDEKPSSTDEVPHIDTAIHEDTLRVDMQKVVDQLRPEWKIDQLVFECKSHGYINKNYHCHMGDGKDGLFVRLVGTKLKEDFLDAAIRFMKYLRRRGMGAKLLCTFVNGLVMEYVHGETVTWQGFRRIKEERNWLGAARELARYHGTTNLDDIRELGIRSYEQRSQDFSEQLKSTLESGIISKKSLENLPGVDELQRLRREIYKQLENMNAELCFCHSDPNPTNFVITDQGLMLVDYDACSFDFAACNIAHFFFAAQDLTDTKFDEPPTEAEKDVFIREYLEQRRLIDPSRDPVTEKQVRLWKYLVRRGYLLMFLSAVGWYIVAQVLEKKLELSNSRVFWDMYRSEKHILEDNFFEEE